MSLWNLLCLFSFQIVLQLYFNRNKSKKSLSISILFSKTFVVIRENSRTTQETLGLLHHQRLNQSSEFLYYKLFMIECNDDIDFHYIAPTVATSISPVRTESSSFSDFSINN